jgi:hypothetical protein
MSIAANSNVSAGSPALEPHYSAEQLGEMWNLSADTIRLIFEREPGVLIIEHTKSLGRRRYRTMRIPQSVALRVHLRKTNPQLHCSPGEHKMSSHGPKTKSLLLEVGQESRKSPNEKTHI